MSEPVPTPEELAQDAEELRADAERVAKATALVVAVEAIAEESLTLACVVLRAIVVGAAEHPGPQAFQLATIGVAALKKLRS